VSVSKKEAAKAAASLDPASHMEMLLKLGRNAVEFSVEAGADRIDGSDDHDWNTGGD
jgi:hypothetical protein